MERASKIQLIQDLLANRLTADDVRIRRMSDAELESEISHLMSTIQDLGVDYHSLKTSDLHRLLNLQLKYDVPNTATLSQAPLPDQDRAFVQYILATGSQAGNVASIPS